VDVAAPLRVLWLELILIGVFGVICAGYVANTDEEVRKDLSPTEPMEARISLQQKVQAMQSKLAAIEQELTALRAQAIAGRIEARRRGVEARTLSNHRSQQPSSTGALASTIENATLAEASSTAFEQSLEKEIERLEKERSETSLALIRVKQEVAAEFTTKRQDYEETRRAELWQVIWRGLAGLVIGAGAAAWLLAPKGRRLAAGAIVGFGVACVAGIVSGYYLFQLLGAGVSALAGLALILVAARVMP